LRVPPDDTWDEVCRVVERVAVESVDRIGFHRFADDFDAQAAAP
jgi:hypothetical protein